MRARTRFAIGAEVYHLRENPYFLMKSTVTAIIAIQTAQGTGIAYQMDGMWEVEESKVYKSRKEFYNYHHDRLKKIAFG